MLSYSQQRLPYKYTLNKQAEQAWVTAWLQLKQCALNKAAAQTNKSIICFKEQDGKFWFSALSLDGSYNWPRGRCTFWAKNTHKRSLFIWLQIYLYTLVKILTDLDIGKNAVQVVHERINERILNFMQIREYYLKIITLPFFFHLIIRTKA